MVGKKNFRSFTDAEQQLYHTSQLLLQGKVTPSQAQAFAKMVMAWDSTHKMKESEEILRRVDGLEKLYKAQKKVVQ
jgi:hypothetical protein